jgi:hypothetical protein
MMPIERVKFHLKPLVDQILDQLPPHVFTSDRTTFLDPAFGGGQFLREVVTRLRACGHSDDNIRSRIYGCEITNFRVKYAQQLGKVVSDNLIKADFLSHDWGTMKFDVVVGNPPYQKDNDSGRDDDSLWPKFLAKALELTTHHGHVAFVTPASWGSLGSNSLLPGSTIRKKHMDTHQMVYVDFTCKKHFQVGSSFTSYVIRNSEPDPVMLTKFVFEDGETHACFSSYPCFPLKHNNQLLNQIIQDWRSRTPYPMLAEDAYPIARASMVKKLSEGVYADKQSRKHPYRSYHTNSQTHRWSKYKNTFHDDWKAVFSYSGTWNVEVTNSCSLTDASMCVLCANQSEAESVQSVLQSAPVKFLIDKVFRWSGYYSGSFIRMIPELPRDKVYTEDQVYDQLFTPDQAALIRSLIHPK